MNKSVNPNVLSSCGNSIKLKIESVVNWFKWGIAWNICLLISDRRIQLLVEIPLCMSQELSQKVSCAVFTTSFLQTFTLQEHMVNGQYLSTMRARNQRSSGQNVGLSGLSRSIRNQVTTFSALVRYWNFFGGPNVGFKRYITVIVLEALAFDNHICRMWHKQLTMYLFKSLLIKLHTKVWYIVSHTKVQNYLQVLKRTLSLNDMEILLANYISNKHSHIA